jgi:phosphatidylserine/phosphatidylglycerophosphate/cardiolipin synthase-like enzyme
MPSASPPSPNSFGYHPRGSIALGREPMIEKIHPYLQLSLVITGIAIVALGMTGSLSLSGVSLIGVGLFVASKLTSTYEHIHTCQSAGIIISSQNLQDLVVSESADCEAIPTEHSADTELWRKKLIASAKKNILISGNYCGGKAFDNLLDDIAKRFEEAPNLKVVIIASPHFITKDNKARIQALKIKHPQNFSFIDSPDIWHLSPGLKKSTNHSKCLVIDYGKYFILGGSGIADALTTTGSDSLSKECFLEQKEGTPAASPVAPKPKKSTNLLSKILPDNFRDMDFVFHSQDGTAGKEVYKQMLLLCHRWEQYNKRVKRKSFQRAQTITLNLSELGIAATTPTEASTKDSVTVQLLHTPIPEARTITAEVSDFNQSTQKSDAVGFRLFASGPEQSESVFFDETIKLIDEAKSVIRINHMYFHPTKKMHDALVRAANRGVKIEIITNGVHERSPITHLAFGPRNKYHYAQLILALPEHLRANVSVYEYSQSKTTSHKKAMIIDDTVLGGSSNLGYKSQVTLSDHELNFIAKSQSFADLTYEVFKEDMRLSHKITNPTQVTRHDYFRTAFHFLMAPLIG